MQVQLVVCLLVVAAAVRGAAVAQVRVAAYNPQIWGVSKAAKSEVVATTVDIVARYDVVLFQEIRDASGTAIFVLLDALNAHVDAEAYHYEMVMSPRLGRTSSKEQYAYLWRNTTLRLDTVATFDEARLPHADVFEREPYVATFAFVGAAPDVPRLTLIGIHVKPDDALHEIGNLSSVAALVAAPAMILGDLNADCTYLSQAEAECCVPLATDPGFDWLIGWDVDTTVKATHCAYDRFVAADALVPYIVPGSATTFDFAAAYGLDQDAADDVSDHYPIEVTFAIPTVDAPPPPPPPPPAPAAAAAPSPPSPAAAATVTIAIVAVVLVAFAVGGTAAAMLVYKRLARLRKQHLADVTMDAYA